MCFLHKVFIVSNGQCEWQLLNCLTPKLLWPIFRSFLKFGQAILVRVLMLNF